MHRDEVAKFNFPCSLCEHIHVDVNTEDCGLYLEDVALCDFIFQHKSNNFLSRVGGDELESFKETQHEED